MDPKFAHLLQGKCPKENGKAKRVNLNSVMANKLEHQYFKNLRKKMDLLSSDQALVGSPLTASAVAKYVKHATLWAEDYASAMVQMGSIDVLTKNEGEI
ncbi:hypothetical protein BUALT_Bualt02G0072100 [Buddleja alternifolia]|uniref:peroxidase n=1 Tax=Buddleja alternifolia TaxID=168488 RepID=A0AAV6XY97_9LAMI|nr:hypothetical protein BUALT_Bualt02G0072100 [Buddleja alternifolia]